MRACLQTDVRPHSARAQTQWEAANKARIDPLDPFAPTRKWLDVDEVLDMTMFGPISVQICLFLFQYDAYTHFQVT